MAILPCLLPAVLLFNLTIISKSTAAIPQSSSSSDDDHRHWIDEIREAEQKVARLESILMKSSSIVDSKDLYVKESEKLVEEITSEVDHLQSVLLTMKNDSACANERFTRLEEEIRLLWDIARRNNFELHNLESKAKDAEKRLKVTKSRVETVAGIVTEQWIQIQHFEQALEISQRGLEEAKRNAIRCSFLKFLKRQGEIVFDEWWEMVVRSWSAVKQNHHQLQGFVKNEMQKWEYTAAYANNEVVFFLASALITFPALSFGVFVLNNFC